MLTIPLDSFRGQSSPQNILPFHMLGIVSSCATITLSLRRSVFPTFEVVVVVVAVVALAVVD